MELLTHVNLNLDGGRNSRFGNLTLHSGDTFHAVVHTGSSLTLGDILMEKGSQFHIDPYVGSHVNTGSMVDYTGGKGRAGGESHGGYTAFSGSMTVIDRLLI